MKSGLAPSTTRPRFLTGTSLMVLATIGAASSGFVLGRTGEALEVHLETVVSAPPICPVANMPQSPMIAAKSTSAADPDPEPEPQTPESNTSNEPLALRANPTVFIACRWDDSGCSDVDDGFPAISKDRQELLVKRSSDDGGRGYPNLSVVRLSRRTGKVIKRYTIVSADELDALGYDEENPSAVAAPLAEKRSVIAQRAIDARGFVALSSLKYSKATGLRITGERPLIQIQDLRSGWTRFQEGFNTRAEFGDGDEENLCHPQSVYGSEAWVDLSSDTALISVTYRAGPCFCDDVTRYYVRTLARVPEALSTSEKTGN